MSGRLWKAWRSGSTSGQRPSHRGLLQRSRRWGNHARLDAIVVPSGRKAGALDHAGKLASHLDAALIVLASHSAKSADIVERLKPLKLRRLHVVDVPTDLADELPAFQTSKILVREGLARDTDVSAKRNLGLAVTRMAGLRRVLFLDDDMRIPRPSDVEVAAGLLRKHEAVGLRLGGFPDNSVVCHAHRETGGYQDTFVGGGALVVDTGRVTSFFPNIYNEDWFFLLDESRLRSVTVTGKALQRPYDPYADPARARFEEFGDVLAEGIFALLDDDRSVGDADEHYWRGFIRQRRALIEKVHSQTRRVWRTDRRKAERMRRSLRAAQKQLESAVTADLCVEYVRAWQNDLADWKAFCAGLDRNVSVEKALERFKLTCAGSMVVSTVPTRQPGALAPAVPAVA